MPIVTFISQDREFQPPNALKIPRHEDLFNMEMSDYPENQEGYGPSSRGFTASFFGEDFYGELAIVSQGRKNHVILLNPERKMKYRMLPSDFFSAAKDGFVNGGMISGTFRFKKTGSAPGVKIIS